MIHLTLGLCSCLWLHYPNFDLEDVVYFNGRGEVMWWLLSCVLTLSSWLQGQVATIAENKGNGLDLQEFLLHACDLILWISFCVSLIALHFIHLSLHSVATITESSRKFMLFDILWAALAEERLLIWETIEREQQGVEVGVAQERTKLILLVGSCKY